MSTFERERGRPHERITSSIRGNNRSISYRRSHEKLVANIELSTIGLVVLDVQPGRDYKDFNVWNNGVLQYSLKKPARHKDPEISLFWLPSFILRSMLPPAEVAVIYCASIGNGGYISFKKDESPKNSTNIFNSLATFLWPVERIEVYEKVYLALKLTNNLYEFKLPSEGVKYTYRWESGELIQFEKPDDRFGRVVAAMTRQGASYKLEIDKSLISIEVVLCTSLISSTL